MPRRFLNRMFCGIGGKGREGGEGIGWGGGKVRERRKMAGEGSEVEGIGGKGRDGEGMKEEGRGG